MQLVAMLIGFALLAVSALVLSLFVTVAGGGSAFDHAWPYFAGVIFVLLSAAKLLASHARRQPDAWLHQSVWPKSLMVVIVAVVAWVFAEGFLL